MISQITSKELRPEKNHRKITLKSTNILSIYGKFLTKNTKIVLFFLVKFKKHMLFKITCKKNYVEGINLDVNGLIIPQTLF